MGLRREPGSERQLGLRNLRPKAQFHYQNKHYSVTRGFNQRTPVKRDRSRVRRRPEDRTEHPTSPTPYPNNCIIIPSVHSVRQKREWHSANADVRRRKHLFHKQRHGSSMDHNTELRLATLAERPQPRTVDMARNHQTNRQL